MRPSVCQKADLNSDTPFQKAFFVETGVAKS